MIQTEIDTLAKYAALVPKGGTIVEIGTHLGDSALIMAEAAPHAKIWTMDTGERYLWERHGEATLEEYTKLVSRRLADHEGIIFMLGSSHPKPGTLLVKWGGEPIDMLFIDGDHEYHPFMADLVRWAPKVARGGYMLLHDYVEGDSLKVWGAANDYLAGYPQWVPIECQATMLVLQHGSYPQ